MTSVRLLVLAGRFVGFNAEGHTGYAPAGEDIVCAGVSTLLQTTVLGLEKLVGLDLQIRQEKKSGFLSCLIPVHADEDQRQQADFLFNFMYLGLQQIALEYPKYVQISLKEVEKDEV